MHDVERVLNFCLLFFSQLPWCDAIIIIIINWNVFFTLHTKQSCFLSNYLFGKNSTMYRVPCTVEQTKITIIIIIIAYNTFINYSVFENVRKLLLESYESNVWAMVLYSGFWIENWKLWNHFFYCDAIFVSTLSLVSQSDCLPNITTVNVISINLQTCFGKSKFIATNEQSKRKFNMYIYFFFLEKSSSETEEN